MSYRLTARAIAGAALAFSAHAVVAQDAPVELQPPAGEKVVLAAWATGAQVYECSSDPATYAWQWRFKGPEAELRDKSGAARTVRVYRSSRECRQVAGVGQAPGRKK